MQILGLIKDNMPILFDIVCIAKNETKTIGRLTESLKEFFDRGGKAFLLDTGSTDETPRIARELGWNVTEVENERFRRYITKAEAKGINKKYVVKGEGEIVAEGDSFFDYSGARNYAATLAEQDMIATPDLDEVYTVLDIDKINEAISNGAEQLEYQFVFSHDSEGKPLIQFTHSKFYNSTRTSWTGVIHEVLSGNVVRKYLDESIIKLEHWQQPSDRRSNYLGGLALACYMGGLAAESPDRASHYFGRELLWMGRPRSAIKELTRHIEMNCWPDERAQSMIYIGEAYRQIGEDEKAIEWWHKALTVGGLRREPLIKLADYYARNADPYRTLMYLNACKDIQYGGFYADNMEHYTKTPYDLIEWAYGQIGKRFQRPF